MVLQNQSDRPISMTTFTVLMSHKWKLISGKLSLLLLYGLVKETRDQKIDTESLTQRLFIRVDNHLSEESIKSSPPWVHKEQRPMCSIIKSTSGILMVEGMQDPKAKGTWLSQLLRTSYLCLLPTSKLLQHLRQISRLKYHARKALRTSFPKIDPSQCITSTSLQTNALTSYAMIHQSFTSICKARMIWTQMAQKKSQGSKRKLLSLNIFRRSL